MERPFPWWSQVYYRFFGNKRLLPYEQLCVDAWRQSLPASQRVVLRTQLAAVDLIRRFDGGARVFLYEVYERKNPRAQALPFTNQAPAQHVADVVLAPNSKKHFGKVVTAKIYTHNGRLAAIQFPKPPDRAMRSFGTKKPTLRVTSVVNTQDLD
jgi:hypothetical protein